jgi:SAM-dependent methyltransferase
VTAIDAAEDMVEAARRNVPGAAAVRQARLPHLPFGDGEFDAVVGNFVVNHVGDPGAAVAEMRRVLRPGGRLAATVWRYPGAAGQTLLWRALEEVGAEKPTGLPRVDADADFPRTVEGFASLLAGNGLREVSCVPVLWEHRTSRETWWADAFSGIPTIGIALKALAPATLAAVRARYDHLADEFTTSDGTLALPHAALLATGTR